MASWLLVATLCGTGIWFHSCLSKPTDTDAWVDLLLAILGARWDLCPLKLGDGEANPCRLQLCIFEAQASWLSRSVGWRGSQPEGYLLLL